jgi:hypothetical protein
MSGSKLFHPLRHSWAMPTAKVIQGNQGRENVGGQCPLSEYVIVRMRTSS